MKISRTGFAHLFEHMMFQGSKNLGKNEFLSLIQGQGGVLNASTRFDFTNFFEILPSPKLETALWAEADRMKGLVITAENLTNQQGVVINEVKAAVHNQPYGGFPWLDMPQYANENWYNAHNFYGDIQDIAAAAAKMGGEINVGVGLDLSTVGGDVLSEFGPELVRLIADIVQNPLFPETEIERLKNDLRRRLSIQMSQPQTLALAKFRKILYGDHPYGRVLSTPDVIQSLTVEKVRNYYRKNFGAGRSHIYVAGRFDKKAVKKAIEEALGGWERGPDPLIFPARTESPRAVHIVDRPGSQQSILYVGLPVIDPSHKDWQALQVTNAILGGASFLSRITINIREDKGYTYTPSSQLSLRYRDAYWLQFASVGNEVTAPALKEILYEIDRLRREPPPQEELKRIQNFMTGNFVLQNSSRQGIVNGLSFVSLQGLDPSYLSTWVQKVHAVTPADVQMIAQTYFLPEKMTIVIVGDKNKIEETLKGFGPIVE